MFDNQEQERKFKNISASTDNVLNRLENYSDNLNNQIEEQELKSTNGYMSYKRAVIEEQYIPIETLKNNINKTLEESFDLPTEYKVVSQSKPETAPLVNISSSNNTQRFNSKTNIFKTRTGRHINITSQEEYKSPVIQKQPKEDNSPHFQTVYTTDRQELENKLAGVTPDITNNNSKSKEDTSILIYFAMLAPLFSFIPLFIFSQPLLQGIFFFMTLFFTSFFAVISWKLNKNNEMMMWAYRQIIQLQSDRKD